MSNKRNRHSDVGRNKAKRARNREAGKLYEREILFQIAVQKRANALQRKIT